MALPTRYDPAAIEAKWYPRWEEAGAFRCGVRKNAKPYTIVIPPPNVTGSLHIGHALDNTIQDILIRFERMRGRDVLWQPGVDHAGIATQMVVERELGKEGKNRRVMGREAFLKRVWQWKEDSGGQIVNQLKRLGASCDWRRSRFTMDEGFSKAVIEKFVALYDAGLIYRDQRLVNWDPKLLTAISDLEVEMREVQGHFWHFRYPIEGLKGKFITVATTRPETMLGDTAVAVHPEDPRYKALVGKTVAHPLTGRKIPIVADEWADPEQGTGAVKITPAHDFNDFEVAKRHDLAMINVLSRTAKISIEQNKAFWENTHFADRFEDGAEGVMLEIGGYQHETGGYVRYQVNDPQLDELRSLGGLDRFDARKKIVSLMEERGLVEKVEPRKYAAPYGDRSGVLIEPYLTFQWYVDAEKLAGPAIKAVKQGKTKFAPRTWEKTFFEWMRNIQPWCISRQLWWGHQIPVWYGPKIFNGPKEGIFCARTEAEALGMAKAYYKKGVEIVERQDYATKVIMGTRIADPESGFAGETVPIYRDPDVLDTWFSSAMWPFATLGWPDETPELKRYYPTSVLVTSFDIIFFWVARMMMDGLHFMKEAPFKTVYIHALVRDEKGQKMSKSKGNVIDPLDFIDRYGADALRFTFAAMEAQGRDIKLSEARVEGYRNFATKLWNAARFAEMNGAVDSSGFDPKTAKHEVNRWIIGETRKAAESVTKALEAFRFDAAAEAIYRFTWGTFCDWYVEFVKPVLAGPNKQAAKEARQACAWTLDQILRLLHPFMPFVTEELWHAFGVKRQSDLILAAWPEPKHWPAAGAAGEGIGWLIRLISGIRSSRAEVGVPPKAKVKAYVRGAGKTTLGRIEKYRALIERLARVEGLAAEDGKAGVTGAAIQVVVDEATFVLPLEGVIDVKAERSRLDNEIGRAEAQIRALDAKLKNKGFTANAPQAVVAEAKERLDAELAAREKLKAALARLS